ncbi:cysteine proteinase [Aulographum hederae CBS 113979]|uniref:ubiquitinyl hydrolase 1 n=1 Tax=Aulographum hederae CBS 113979 TaxID=1176131 RepID=A0A6G1GLY2_9PEZI|nr:cysteine proteinase [Aulographum hederae CBS 113979]
MDQIGSDMMVDSDYDDKQDVAIIAPDDAMDGVEAEPETRADDFEAMRKRFMPDLPDLEIETDAVHTWEIEHWRKLAKREHGPVFKSGEHPWKVLFFPFGNNVEFASFYLEHGFDDKPPEDWYACVQFMLVLWNPNDPTIHTHHVATHRFTADEGDWGFTRFVELRRLFNSSFEGKSRPMVENDCAKLTSYVRVLKDPTGVLWHNFVNYDSKKETGMVGLRNQGATCYLNSLLQSLYFTNAFRKAVYQIPTESEVDYRTNSAYALQRLFYQLQTSTGPVNTNELTSAFGWDSRQIFEQQDVQELSRILMERMEEKMKGTEAEDSLARMFVGKMKTYVSCIDVLYESSRTEEFWDIQLNVTGNKNLDASFQDYIQVEIMNGENKYQAEGFGLQDAKKGVIFESFPQVLHLQLKRFEYDFQRDVMMKINDRYEFPEIWDASPYLSDEADRSESYVYRLHSVLVHSGDLNAGHYYAFIKPNKDDGFFKFDDDRVTRATDKEAMEENFGGDYPGMANGQRNPYTRTWSAKRSMNAYMLVYVRESKFDTVMMTGEVVEPPTHLETRFNEERAVVEKRRKDREEAHLYMEVQVATNENFRAHQGFDIVPWTNPVQGPETPETLRVLKQMSVGDFTIKAASERGLDPEQVRAWVVVNRQNGTARPDQPLVFPDMSIDEAASKYGTKSSNFRIWLEEAKEKDGDGKPIWADSKVDQQTAQQNRPILLFLKCFEVENQTLLGMGHFYAAWQDKVSDISEQILALTGWPAGTSFKLYEEIKRNMIETMKPKSTLAASELQDGDIITVQKAIPEKDALALQIVGKYSDTKDFYDWMLNRVSVKFQPRGAEDDDGAFELVLSQKMSYDQLSARVGEHLGVDRTHLRFCPVNLNTGRPKAPLKYTTVNNLGQMLNPNTYAYGTVNTQRNDAFYYEILEFSMAELEQRRGFKVLLLSEGLSKEEQFEVLVPRNGTVQDIIDSVAQKANIPEEVVGDLRLYESHGNKIYKEPPMSAGVSTLNEYVSLFIERIPEEEPRDVTDNDEGRKIHVFSFEKEPNKAHWTPFIFWMKNGEVFKDTKERLSKRIGIKGKQFEKIKFAVVPRNSYSKPEQIEDDDILSEKLTGREDMLGMDHPNKNRNQWARNDQIFIR